MRIREDAKMRYTNSLTPSPTVASKGPYSTKCTSLSFDFLSIETRKESQTMLFTVSLAFLVPFISAASLPVLLHPNSPDSNDAIFQDQNTTSLTTSLITPLSVTGRLNNTSNSNYASTTNSSSLGVVNTQAYDPRPPRYPPGYPGRPYDYFVPNSNIRLHCDTFRPDPRQNAGYLNQLFERLRIQYFDPRLSSVHVWRGGAHFGSEYHWLTGHTRIGQLSLSLKLPDSHGRPDFNMTFGDLTNTLIGLHHIIHDYPMLAINMTIYRLGSRYDIGFMYLVTHEPRPG